MNIGNVMGPEAKNEMINIAKILKTLNTRILEIMNIENILRPGPKQDDKHCKDFENLEHKNLGDHEQ